MMQVVLHHFPAAEVEYYFKLRKPDIDFRPYAQQIRIEINNLAELSFDNEEINYLQTFPYFKPDFIALLRCFKFNPGYVEINTERSFELKIRGPWLQTILFEVPLLAIISEIYFRNTYTNNNYIEGKQRLKNKIEFINQQKNVVDFKFSEFGTRRRYSRDWQSYVIEQLTMYLSPHFIGTSNVFYAKKFGLTPIGTMAHEFVQAFQALGPNLRESQKTAFEVWMQEYRGQLSIALADTLGLTPFLQDFDFYLAKLYDGIRQDSGDPFTWAEAVINHYRQLGIDPKTKTIIFSDALTIPKAYALYQRFSREIHVLFGIGTNLTNDLGDELLDMVIKMVRCNGQPVAKISGEPGKAISSDEQYLNYLKHLLKT